MQPLIISLRALIFFSLLTGLAYPLIVLALGQLAFSSQAGGSLISTPNQLLGSGLIGQPAKDKPGYFTPRPSATSPKPYNAESSSGSNYGPLNPDFQKALAERRAALAATNPGTPIPIDLLTASASGLDPHISPEAAEFQLPRIARERSIPIDRLRILVNRFTEPRQFGILGEPRVNVVQLNLALDGVL